MYLLLHDGVQFAMSRVSALPPAFVSMKIIFAESTAPRTAYAIGVATMPILSALPAVAAADAVAAAEALAPGVADGPHAAASAAAPLATRNLRRVRRLDRSLMSILPTWTRAREVTTAEPKAKQQDGQSRE